MGGTVEDVFTGVNQGQHHYDDQQEPGQGVIEQAFDFFWCLPSCSIYFMGW
jgi:hypothetical protein